MTDDKKQISVFVNANTSDINNVGVSIGYLNGENLTTIETTQLLLWGVSLLIKNCEYNDDTEITGPDLLRLAINFLEMEFIDVNSFSNCVDFRKQDKDIERKK